MTGWKRFELFRARALNQDGFVFPDAKTGFIAMGSPYDPEPEFVWDGEGVARLDGKSAREFDLIDHFLARHAFPNPAVTAEVLATPDRDLARMLVDVGVPRDEAVSAFRTMTPAKISRVLSMLDVAEITFAMKKMRARLRPSNQAHVTNRKDDPLQLAADAACAAAWGFREIETTVALSRAAASNAVAVLVGSQVGSPGVLTQCSVEEATELSLGLRGFTTYAETLSNYGNEKVFLDGDDTPWSKAFLAAVYASRGIKTRFTSGAGSEVLMGSTDGCSMLYLESRCVLMTRATGVQGVQNGGIDGVCIAGAVPGGVRELAAENLLVMSQGLEACTGNDSQFSHSDIRRTVRTMPQLLAGTDYITSGTGSILGYDNMFSPSNWNGDDIEEWLAIQRDLEVDGALRTVPEEELLALRRRAVDAIDAVFQEIGLPPFPEDAKEVAVSASGSRDTHDRDGRQNILAGEALQKRSGVDIVRALARRGFPDVAERVLAVLKSRTTGEYLQPASILDEEFRVLNSVSTPNDYAGPGTGYVIGQKRREEIHRIRQEATVEDVIQDYGTPRRLRLRLSPLRAAEPSDAAAEVVIGVSPAFGAQIQRTMGGLDLGAVLRELLYGLEEASASGRIVRFNDISDLGRIGLGAARLAGSGIGVGLLSKGTAVIHRAGLDPLENLELFPMAPLISLEDYRRIGVNAGLYARGIQPMPHEVPNLEGIAVEARYLAQAALLYQVEVRAMADAPPDEVTVATEDV